MAWFKVYARHGAGHQGYTEHYYYSPYPLSKEEKQDLWNEYFVDHSWYDYPIGDCVRVRRLPEKIKEQKILEYRTKLVSAKYMLNILGEK